MVNTVVSKNKTTIVENTTFTVAGSSKSFFESPSQSSTPQDLLSKGSDSSRQGSDSNEETKVSTPKEG